MDDLRWPTNWQPEAIAVIEPYLGTEERLDVDLGHPDLRYVGRIAGHVYRGEDDWVTMINDHSGRWDVYPWRLDTFSPTVILQVALIRPRVRSKILFRHPGWTGNRGPARVRATTARPPDIAAH